MNAYITNFYPKPNGTAADQRLTVDATVGGVQFTNNFATSTDTVSIDIQGADVMVTFDGSAPTTTNGHRLYDTRSYTWSKAAAVSAKFIRQALTDASIHLSQFTS